MDPKQEEKQIEELKRKRTKDWVTSHKYIKLDLDADDDPLDDAPISRFPRRVYSPKRSREFGSAFDEVTPGMYRSLGQSWSCEHVRDDPFEDEEKCNDGYRELTNVNRSCRDCYVMGAYLKRSKEMLSSKRTFQWRSAEEIESDSQFDPFGIWAADTKRLFPAQSNRIETSQSPGQQYKRSSEKSASPTGSEDATITYSPHLPEYEHEGQQDEPKIYSPRSPETKTRVEIGTNDGVQASSQSQATENVENGATAESGTLNKDLDIPSGGTNISRYG